MIKVKEPLRAQKVRLWREMTLISGGQGCWVLPVVRKASQKIHARCLSADGKAAPSGSTRVIFSGAALILIKDDVGRVWSENDRELAERWVPSATIMPLWTS